MLTFRPNPWFFLPLSLPLAAVMANAQQIGGPGVIVEDEEIKPNRYSIEIILFTYDDSVSAGTEVFIPETKAAATFNNPSGGMPPGDGSRADAESMRTGSIDPFDPSFPGENDGGIDGDSEPTFGDTLPIEDEAPPIDLSKPLELIMTDTARIEYTPLPPELRRLTATHERLLLLDAYNPVLWSGWTQIVLEEGESPALNLRRLGNLPLTFDGELTLYLGRFVHLVVDIALEDRAALTPELQRPDSFGEDDTRRYGDFGRYDDQYSRRAPDSIRYRINEDRIMRNGETRYFDHPRFGLIARLTLVEEPEADEDDSRFLPDLLPGAAEPPPTDDSGI